MKVIFVVLLGLLALSGAAFAQEQNGGGDAPQQLGPSWILPLAPAGYGGPGVISPYSNVNPLNPMAAQMQEKAAGVDSTHAPQTELGPAHNDAQTVTHTANFLEMWDHAVYGVDRARHNSIEKLGGYIHDKHAHISENEELIAHHSEIEPMLLEVGKCGCYYCPCKPMVEATYKKFVTPNWKEECGCKQCPCPETVEPEIKSGCEAAECNEAPRTVFIKPEKKSDEEACGEKSACKKEYVTPEIKKDCKCAGQVECPCSTGTVVTSKIETASPCGCKGQTDCHCAKKHLVEAEVKKSTKTDACECKGKEECDCNKKPEFAPKVPDVDACGDPVGKCEKKQYVQPELKAEKKPANDCQCEEPNDNCACKKDQASPYRKAEIAGDDGDIKTASTLPSNKQ